MESFYDSGCRGGPQSSRARYGSNRSLVVQLLSIHGYAMYLWEQPERTHRTEFIRDGVSRGFAAPIGWQTIYRHDLTGLHGANRKGGCNKSQQRAGWLLSQP